MKKTKLHNHSFHSDGKQPPRVKQVLGGFMDFKSQVIKILQETQCGHCDYDEAEGEHLSYCDNCCRKIVNSIFFFASQPSVESDGKKRCDIHTFTKNKGIFTCTVCGFKIAAH